jgi:thiol:disulfide interchange protein
LKRSIAFALTALAFVSARSVSAEIPAAIAWSEDFTNLAESEKPTFIALGATWCNPCRMLHEITFRDPAVVDAASAYRAIRVDVDENSDIARRYRVSLLPTILFLDATGQEIARVQGFIPAKRLTRVMKTIADLLHHDHSTDEIRRLVAERF